MAPGSLRNGLLLAPASNRWGKDLDAMIRVEIDPSLRGMLFAQRAKALYLEQLGCVVVDDDLSAAQLAARRASRGAVRSLGLGGRGGNEAGEGAQGGGGRGGGGGQEKRRGGRGL